MTALRRIWIIGLLGMWASAGWAQEAAEENAAGAEARPEAAVGGGAAEAQTAAEPETGLQPQGTVEAGATETGAADPDAALPEIAPLDELFVPSLGIRADEPWDDMPVDF